MMVTVTWRKLNPSAFLECERHFIDIMPLGVKGECHKKSQVSEAPKIMSSMMYLLESTYKAEKNSPGFFDGLSMSSFHGLHVNLY